MSDPLPNRPAAAPGWYPTPNGEIRYWDGLEWTGHAERISQPGQAVQPYSGHAYAPHQYQPQQAQPMHGGMPYGTVVVAPKSPGLALIASFFIPGLGQFINGDGAKGAMFLIVYVVSWVLIFVLIGIPMVFITWVWSMVDAYTSAKSWNAARGIIS